MCDLEVINEKLFQSISQSVNEENGDREFNKACTEKMKELLANALVEQEERVVRLFGYFICLFNFGLKNNRP